MPPLSSEVTAAYRRRTVALRAQTYRDLLRLWPAFDPDNPQPWMEGANALAMRDYHRAEALALEYTDIHAAAAGAEVELRTAEAFDTTRAATSTRVTSLVAFRTAIGAGKTRAQALDISYVRSSGAISRIALDGGRSAIMRTAAASPQVKGWRRTGSPQCQWCKELIGRGTTYHSESTASFAAHDHCSCGAENVYTGETRGVRQFEQSGRFREQAQRDANNARIRAYLKTL